MAATYFSSSRLSGISSTIPPPHRFVVACTVTASCWPSAMIFSFCLFSPVFTFLQHLLHALPEILDVPLGPCVVATVKGLFGEFQVVQGEAHVSFCNRSFSLRRFLRSSLSLRDLKSSWPGTSFIILILLKQLYISFSDINLSFQKGAARPAEED